MQQSISLHLNKFAYFLVFFLLWSFKVNGQGDLFFSEYVEGDSNQDCIEIFNPTNRAITLDNTYRIVQYRDGGNTPTVLSNLKGTIRSKETYVVCDRKLEIYTTTGQKITAPPTGNDALTLEKDGVEIDIFGVIGCGNPGEEGWSVDGQRTKNITLRRKPCITAGITARQGCNFPGVSEWQAFPAQTFSNLGIHNFGIDKIEISGNNALCENPSITLTATAGFTAYEWSNGNRTNTTSINSAGNYSVTVTSAIGCRATATKTINGQSPAINATISNIRAVSCIPKKDGGFTVNPSGGSGGFSYAWETGTSTNRTITGIGAGNYKLTVTDNNGCSIVQPVEIGGTVTVPLTADIASETCKGRGDGAITLSAIGSSLTYAIAGNPFQQNNRFIDLVPGDYVVQVQDNSGCGDQKKVTIPEGSNFNLRNSQIIQASCQGAGEGGQIILIPQGGQTPYQVSFDGGLFSDKKVFSNLKEGIFDIIIKDGSGCEKAFQQEMEAGSDLTLDNLIVTPALCKGIDDGGVQLVLNGGSGNISYNKRVNGVLRPFFSPTFVDLAAGSHQIIIRDNEFDCRIPVNFEIPVLLTLEAEISTAPLCEATQTGSFAVIPQNGFAPYQYSLDSNAFGMDSVFQDIALKNYVVTTMDNDGCTTKDSVIFEDAVSFEIVFALPKVESCAGNEDGQITVAANSIAEISYSLDGINYRENNVLTGLAAGDYLVYAKSGNCTVSEMVTIPAVEAIILEQVIPQIALCEGGNDGQLTVMVAGGTAPYTYKLDQDTFQSSSVFSNLTQGIYTLTVRDANQCEQVFTEVILPGPVRLDPECTVTQQVTTIGGSDGSAMMIIFGGEPPYNVQLMDAGFNNIVSVNGLVSFDTLSAGDYVAQVRDANDCINTCEFTIEAPQCDFSIDHTQTNATCFDSLNGIIKLILPTENLPFTINWSDTIYNGQQNLSALASGEYRVTVTDTQGCIDSTAITITKPAPLSVQIETANTTICAQDSTKLLLTESYANYAWSNGADSATTTVYKMGNYQVIVENELGCVAIDKIAITVLKQDTILESRLTCDPTNIGTFMTEERNENGCNNIILRTFELASKDTTLIIMTTCNPLDSGRFQTILPNIFGCDSLVITTVELLRLDTTYQTLVNCNSTEVGISEVVLTNQFGCDSLLIIETILEESLRQSFSTNFTCNPIEVGVDTTFVQTLAGCDSLVITTIELLRLDTTYQTLMNCNSAEVGISEVVLTNQFGCDSLLIIETILEESLRQSFSTNFTCNPMAVGVDTTFVQTVAGCDSLVITTIELLRLDTTYQTLMNCNSTEVGISEVVLTNQFGCDSLLIIETILEENLRQSFSTNFTCNPMAIGIDTTFVQTLAGCDSLVITTIELLRLDTTYQTLMNCNSTEVGISEVVLTNQFGCDSLLIIETILEESLRQSFSTNFTCNPMEVGVDTTFVQTLAGCDSLVIIITNLNPSDAFFFMEESCNPQDTGMVIQALINQFGCDSIITTHTTLSPVNECQIGFSILTNSICEEGIVGTIQININTGNLPFTYYLLDDFNKDTLQNGQILQTETLLTNIPIGQYSISLVNEKGFESRQSLSITQLPAYTINAQLSDYNGFAISCMGEMDGSIDLAISGGKAPYTYLWEDGHTTKELQNLAVGNYGVTVTDANNCTSSATFNLVANEALNMDIQTTNTSCFGNMEIGQLIIMDLSNANGTVEYSLDGSFFQPLGPLPFAIENLPLGDYELYLQDENDCQANTNFTIPMAANNQLTLGDDQILLLGDSLTLIPEANFDITRFEWMSTVPLPCIDCPTINMLPVQNGQYTLTAYDANDCSLTTTVAVRLAKESHVFMPNVFSPNNDGINDRYQIFTGNSVSHINQFQIFDYEGRLMYQVNDSMPNDKLLGWDGRFNGQKMMPAVFIVIMEVTLIDGTTKQYRETMTLIE